MSLMLIIILLCIGAISGIASGVFGIGGGVLIVPGLTLFAGFSQHLANGTSLAVLLPPIGVAAVIEYYRAGDVDFRAAALIAVSMILGAWLGARIAHFASGAHLRLGFGIFVMFLGIFLVVDAVRELT